MLGPTCYRFGRPKHLLLVGTRRGQHQKPDQAKQAERGPAPAQQGRPLGAEDANQVRRAQRGRGTETSGDALKLAITRLDKAAGKGTIHKNQAARRKSRLVRRINKLTAAE
jgi:small subunit ribosomal protein S20